MAGTAGSDGSKRIPSPGRGSTSRGRREIRRDWDPRRYGEGEREEVLGNATHGHDHTKAEGLFVFGTDFADVRLQHAQVAVREAPESSDTQR